MRRWERPMSSGAHLLKVCTLHICLHCPQLDLLGATWEEISKQAIQRKKQRNNPADAIDSSLAHTA